MRGLKQLSNDMDKFVKRGNGKVYLTQSEVKRRTALKRFVRVKPKKQQKAVILNDFMGADETESDPRDDWEFLYKLSQEMQQIKGVV